MLVHSGERPFRCHICGTHFTTNGNMHRHIRGHYRNGGVGSDSGDSDGGSEGDMPSPRKRRLDFGEEGPGGKMARLQSEHYSADDEVSLPVEDISCPVCGEEQNGASGLEVHLEKEHPEHSLSLKANPMRRSSTPGTEPADLSPAKLTIIPSHDRGERVMEGFGGAVHHCPTCSLPFPTVESWLLHLRDHPTLKCNLCDSTFESISEYSSHQQRHSHESSLRSDALSLFERSQNSPSSSSIFPRGLPFTMAQQPISFANSDSLKRGILSSASPLSLSRHPSIPHHTHSPLSLPNPSQSSLSHDEQFARDYKDMKMNGQYPCRLCKEVFANLRKLKSHNLVHMIAPPYQCNLCSFVSNDKNTLKEHMKNHKGDTPYECNLCSLSFTTKANCERHIKNIHGRQTRDEVKRCMTYTPQEDCPSSQETSIETICHLCKLDCKSRSVLRDHMRSSHPEGIDKPYSCKICHLAFQSSSDSYRHIIQAHQDAVSSESLETLVETRSRRDEVQDLSSVETLLTFSKLSLPITSSCKPTVRQSSPAQTPNIPCTSTSLYKVTPFSPTTTIVSPALPISAYTPPSTSCEDVPLDLSMNKRSRNDEEKDKERKDNDGSDDEEITVIDEEENIPCSQSINLTGDSGKTSKQDVVEIKTTSGSPHSDRPSSENKSAFPLIYPGQLPVQFLQFQSQYPFLMNPFGALPPVPNFQLLEQYQEIKRGLQLTSGGTLLTPDGNNSLIPSMCNSLLNSPNNHFIKSGTSAFQLSAMALAASQADQQPSDDNGNEEGRSQTLATDLSPSRRETEEMSHFTMRNSVLVKKPKQRRYRTERPWRCDLCDKGFTLRSNMERHMKQQHPDLWQQRPRGAPHPQRIGNSSSESRDQFGQATIDTPKLPLKSDPDEAMSETTDGGKEDEESELIIDDEEEDEEDEEEIDETNEDIKQKPKEEGGPDLASVQKLLSTASSQNFSFFHRETEESDKNEEHSSPCGSPLSQYTSSEDGKKSAYSSAPQKQKCPFCHRKFPWSSSLVRHIRTHTGQKPYLCPVCHFPFTTKSNCDRHLQRKHPDSPHALVGDRPYRCSKCPGAAFTSVESLRKHEMFKHEKENGSSQTQEDLEPFGPKAFRCYLCDVQCSFSKEMLHHIAEAHPDSFGTLRLHDNHPSSTITPASPTTTENNNENIGESLEDGTDLVSSNFIDYI
ncbi:UNVERIFIED_CONTAM: hypothetical protein GTU68_031912 [Idotea baltica]|nr:hypothetical protein [Idotea baltica]